MCWIWRHSNADQRHPLLHRHFCFHILYCFLPFLKYCIQYTTFWVKNNAIFYFFFSIQFFIILFPRYLPDYSFYNCSIPAVPLLRYSKYLLNYSIYNQVSRYLIWSSSDVSLHILWNPILCGIYVQYVCWIIVKVSYYWTFHPPYH